MGVIPLTASGNNPTVVTDPRSFDFHGRAVQIRNFDENQLSGKEGCSNLCYDLRVGVRYRDHRERGSHTLGRDGTITLLPGSAVVIETMEEVQLPERMFGYVVPKVGLLQLGLTNTSSKIDPGYSGHLLITVFNAGRNREVLRPAQRFCAMVLHEVADWAQVTPHRGGSKAVPGDARLSPWRRVRDLFEENHAVILFVLVLLYVIQLLDKVWHFLAPVFHR